MKRDIELPSVPHEIVAVERTEEGEGMVRIRSVAIVHENLGHDDCFGIGFADDLQAKQRSASEEKTI